MENWGILLESECTPIKLHSGAVPEIDWKTYNELGYDDHVIGSVGCKYCLSPLHTDYGQKKEAAAKFGKAASEITERDVYLVPGFFHDDPAAAGEAGCPKAALEFLCNEPPFGKSKCASSWDTPPHDLWEERVRRVRFLFSKIDFDFSKENFEKNKEAVREWEKNNGGAIKETIAYFWHELTGRWPSENDEQEIAILKNLSMFAVGIDAHPWAVPYLVALFADSRLHQKSRRPGFYRDAYECEGEKTPINKDKPPQPVGQDLPIGEDKCLWLPLYLHRFFRQHRPDGDEAPFKKKKNGGIWLPVVEEVSESFVKKPIEEKMGLTPTQTTFRVFAVPASGCRSNTP